MSAILKGKKVLYISDSLGTPIHPRGIYYYSVSMCEMLSDMGLDLTLLVERADGFGIPPFLRTKLAEAGASGAEDVFASSEIYRYFDQIEFSGSLPLREINSGNDRRILGYLDDEGLDYVSEAVDSPMSAEPLTQAQKRQLAKAKEIAKYEALKKEHRQLKRDFLYCKNQRGLRELPVKKGAHLDVFNGFLWADSFYSDSMSYAVNEVDPITVDAVGYDLVFIDTPHYVKVTGVSPDCIFSVVHDLIPVRDYSTNAEWRHLFFEKLHAVLSLDPNLIFVSEFTRNIFHRQLPSIKLRSETIVYPTIKSAEIEASTKARAGDFSSYLKGITTSKIENRISDIRDYLCRNGLDDSINGDEFKKVDQASGHWDSSLPYFCTALSDEPRKNIKALVEASRALVGKANIVVMGKVNGNLHMGMMPQQFPNLHFTGYVSDQQKSDILRHACGVAFPSFAEGFGIPVVEGALYRVPVLCSNIEVFREIGRDRVTYFDPYDTSSLVKAMLYVLENQSKVRALAEDLYPTLVERFSQLAMQKRLKSALELVVG